MLWCRLRRRCCCFGEAREKVVTSSATASVAPKRIHTPVLEK